jgi:hypothetical protein
MRPQSEIKFEAALPAVDHKVCAVKKCVWCGYATDQYFITCPMCRNCQWCGYVDEVDPFRCYLCGNYLPEHLRPEITPVMAT